MDPEQRQLQQQLQQPQQVPEQQQQQHQQQTPTETPENKENVGGILGASDSRPISFNFSRTYITAILGLAMQLCCHGYEANSF